MDPSADEPSGECGEACDHSFILKDDLGLVCRICGIIQKGIETIFEFQYSQVLVLYFLVQLISLCQV